MHFIDVHQCTFFTWCSLSWCIVIPDVLYCRSYRSQETVSRDTLLWSFRPLSDCDCTSIILNQNRPIFVILLTIFLEIHIHCETKDEVLELFWKSSTRGPLIHCRLIWLVKTLRCLIQSAHFDIKKSNSKWFQVFISDLFCFPVQIHFLENWTVQDKPSASVFQPISSSSDNFGWSSMAEELICVDNLVFWWVMRLKKHFY